VLRNETELLQPCCRCQNARHQIVLDSQRAHTATLFTQALESRVNWACWAITQGIIRPQDLSPPRDGNVRHVLPAVRSFLAQIPTPGDPRALAPFIGCDADVRSLAEHTLELLHQVQHERTYARRLQSFTRPLSLAKHGTPTPWVRKQCRLLHLGSVSGSEIHPQQPAVPTHLTYARHFQIL
jgi:hypothetical protein